MPQMSDPPEQMRTKKGSHLGGFRIEVSVQAPTLERARQLVKDSGLLQLNTWFYNSSNPHLQKFKLDIKTVTKDLYQPGLLIL